MTDDKAPPLSERIAKAREQQAKQNKAKEKQQSESISAGGMALRYGAEFGAAVFVGILMGLGIDTIFGTEPWGLLIMLGFGLAAGILGVIRAYQQLTAQFSGRAEEQDAPDKGNEG